MSSEELERMIADSKERLMRIRCAEIELLISFAHLNRILDDKMFEINMHSIRGHHGDRKEWNPCVKYFPPNTGQDGKPIQEKG